MNFEAHDRAIVDNQQTEIVGLRNERDHLKGIIDVQREELAYLRVRVEKAEAQVKKLESTLRECLEQAEGCWLNHYPGEDMATASTPLHIAAARTALGDTND